VAVVARHPAAVPGWRLFSDAQDGVLTAAQALSTGSSRADISTRVRRGEWQRLFRGTFLVDAEMYPEPPARALIRAAGLAVPRAVVCGRSAARLRGLGGTDEREWPVELAVPCGRRPRGQRGLCLRQVDVPPEHVTVIDGMRVTSPLWTIGDLLLRLPRMEAVSALDAALHAGHLTTKDLAGLEPLLGHRPGAVEARRRLAEADGLAESPLETRVRLICRDGGVAPDALQHPVRDRRGHVLGYGDMAWTHARLIGEADGRTAHDTIRAVYRDRRRANDFRAEGWTIVRFTWTDTLRPAYIVSTVRRVLAATPR
jgi:hypothetical protein